MLATTTREEVQRIAYEHGDMRPAPGEPDLPVDAQEAH